MQLCPPAAEMHLPTKRISSNHPSSQRRQLRSAASPRRAARRRRCERRRHQGRRLFRVVSSLEEQEGGHAEQVAGCRQLSSLQGAQHLLGCPLHCSPGPANLPALRRRSPCTPTCCRPHPFPSCSAPRPPPLQPPPEAGQNDGTGHQVHLARHAVAAARGARAPRAPAPAGGARWAAFPGSV